MPSKTVPAAAFVSISVHGPGNVSLIDKEIRPSSGLIERILLERLRQQLTHHLVCPHADEQFQKHELNHPRHLNQ